MKKKESGYHVETSAQPSSKVGRKLPTRADYLRQGIIFSILGVTFGCSLFFTLPASMSAAMPLWVLIVATCGFLSCGAAGFLGAAGVGFRHPIHFVITALQFASALTLFIWFVFGDNHLTSQWRLVTGIFFGLVTFILALPIIVKIFFPGLMEQAMQEAEAELLKDPTMRKRD